MTSLALTTWRGERSDRLDELFAVHHRIGGPAPGRRTDTQQINWALVLRLAGEFQGFVRDLHAEGVDVFAAWASGGNPALENVITTLLTRGLKLDTGNAEPGSIGDAFNRFGLIWWNTLDARDRRTAERQRKLTRLNEARNAIAHARLHELTTLRTAGFPLTLVTARTWRAALNGLTITMDGALAAHLATFFSRASPW
jgi:hypothetical protein